MKFLKWSKDGGPESNVSGFFFVEIKRLFSVALLRFDNGSREAYHSHAFDCLSWVINGKLLEVHKGGGLVTYSRSIVPIKTFRDTFHKVVSFGTTWVFTIRGPWADEWFEYLPDGQTVTLTHGRKEV